MRPRFGAKPGPRTLERESEAALELADVVKEYPGRPPIRALDGVSLSIGHGDMVAVAGPSGSGKSTMLHVMGTLDRPSSGRVLVDGFDTGALSERELAAVRGQRIGFVFQSFFLLPGTSALGNVANGLLYTGASATERRERARGALERVGLGHRLDHEPNELSGGERQRVAIARALVHSPAFVLADEPTGNLDSASSGSIMELLHSLHDEGATIVVITHDRAIADAMPRQLRLLDGRILDDVRSPS